MYSSSHLNITCLVTSIIPMAVGNEVMSGPVVAEWSRYRTVAGLVTSLSPVPLKTHHLGERCTLNLSRAQMSSRWFGVVVRRGGASSGTVLVT
ncbi:uncharacterized protein TNCV_4781701 [Trichonephila clavipes]|nr:uncharacterized protein TNCV_4781701 [Trichonephila clavipes]